MPTRSTKTSGQWRGVVFLLARKDASLPYLCKNKKVPTCGRLPHPIFQSATLFLCSPVCQLILPQDRPPSQCLPRWLLGSNTSCPGWYELMIAARASQPSLIHYVTQAGLLRFLTLTAQHRAPPFADNPSDPPTLHPLAVLQHTAYGGQGGKASPWFNLKLCSERLDLSAQTFPDWRWMRACFPDLSTFLPSIKGSNSLQTSQRRDSTNLKKKKGGGLSIYPFWIWMHQIAISVM